MNKKRIRLYNVGNMMETSESKNVANSIDSLSKQIESKQTEVFSARHDIEINSEQEQILLNEIENIRRLNLGASKTLVNFKSRLNEEAGMGNSIKLKGNSIYMRSSRVKDEFLLRKQDNKFTINYFRSLVKQKIVMNQGEEDRIQKSKMISILAKNDITDKQEVCKLLRKKSETFTISFISITSISLKK